MAYLLLVFALIIKALTATTCATYRECYTRTISTSNVYCYGRQSCSSADITASGTLQLDSRYSGSSATIDAATVNVPGYYGAISADITATTVNAYSLRALQSTDISPRTDSGTVTVNFYAYQSGYSTDITCNEGQTCIVKCLSPEACYDVDVFCYSGSTCTITEECGESSSTANYCLDVYSSNTGGGLTDVEIRNIYLDRKLKKPDGVDTIPDENPDEPDEPGQPFEPNQPFEAVPDQFGNYYLSLTSGQFMVLAVMSGMVILVSIGLCVYNLSGTAKQYFAPKEDFN